MRPRHQQSWLAAVLLLCAAPPGHAYLADYGETYYSVPIDGRHNQAVCRQLEGRHAMRNTCRTPPQLPLPAKRRSLGARPQ